jgi:flagellar motor component MotA
VPISGKLTQKAKRSWFLKSVMLIGLVSLARQESPNQLRQKLEAFQHQVQQSVQAVENINDNYYQPTTNYNNNFAATAQQEYRSYTQV